MGYKTHDDITKRLCGHIVGISFSLPLVGIQARVGDGVQQAYGRLGGGALLQYSGLLLRLYDTQHSEEDGVSFVLPYWRWVSSQIRHPERTNSSKDGYRTRDGKIVCNPPTSPLIYIKSTTEIKTWTLRTSSRVVTWSPVVLSLLLCLVLMKQTAGREYMQSIVQRREKRPREKNKPGGL